MRRYFSAFWGELERGCVLIFQIRLVFAYYSDYALANDSSAPETGPIAITEYVLLAVLRFLRLLAMGEVGVLARIWGWLAMAAVSFSL